MAGRVRERERAMVRMRSIWLRASVRIAVPACFVLSLLGASPAQAADGFRSLGTGCCTLYGTRVQISRIAATSSPSTAWTVNRADVDISNEGNGYDEFAQAGTIWAPSGGLSCAPTSNPGLTRRYYRYRRFDIASSQYIENCIYDGTIQDTGNTIKVSIYRLSPSPWTYRISLDGVQKYDVGMLSPSAARIIAGASTNATTGFGQQYAYGDPVRWNRFAGTGATNAVEIQTSSITNTGFSWFIGTIPGVWDVRV